MAGVNAGNEGIQPLDLVGQAICNKKIQRAICDRRLRAKSVFAQPVQDRIRAKRAVILQQYLEHLAPHRRKAKTVSRTTGFGSGKCLAHTCAVIMLRKPQRAAYGVYLALLNCHVITLRIIGM